MSTNVALKAVPKGPTTDKKKREQINCIETLPNPAWFVRTKERGREVVYLRLQMTGLFPRRFGPFQNSHQAVLALDAILHAMTDSGCEVCDAAEKYGLKRPFQQSWGPVIEDDLALQKGR